MRHPRRGGFSLVELMVVVAVIALVSAAAVPALLSSLPAMRASGAARQVLSDLRLARTMAVDRGANAVVDVYAPASGEYRVYLDLNGNGSFDATPTDTLIKDVRLPADFTGIVLGSGIAATPADGVEFAGANAVTFRPNGSASAAGSVYLMPTQDAGGRKDRNRRVEVVAAATGNVRTWIYDGTSWQ